MTTSQPLTSPAPAEDPTSTPWWRDAVIYQVYPRSYADADGDGIGDLPGITSRIPYLRDLGVDAIWVSPFYTSPQADAGYDVADYRDIDPVFGTLADADTFIATAHEAGIKVVVDLVPNHSSDEHPWFQAALAAGPGSAERDLYMFRDGKGPDGEQPPTDWRSVFGGPAWTRVTEPDGTPGQWYLHLFDVKQPDLNWSNPKVHEAFDDILRFWLDRGVDGFRVDVAHGLVKEEGLPDWASEHKVLDHNADAGGRRPPMWDQDGVHAMYREWRKILDSYPGDRMMVAEAWVEPAERRALYVRPDEFHQAFNFDFLETPWRAIDQRKVIEDSLAAAESWVPPPRGCSATTTCCATPPASALPAGQDRGPTASAPSDPQPDAALGLRRARAATLLMLALPGSAYLYQGEELGPARAHLAAGRGAPGPDVVRRTDHEVAGRDGCRVPLPWTAEGSVARLRPERRPWLPQPRVVPGAGRSTSRTASPARRSRCTGPPCGCAASTASGRARSCSTTPSVTRRSRCATARCSWSPTSAPTRSPSPDGSRGAAHQRRAGHRQTTPGLARRPHRRDGLAPRLTRVP